MADTVGHLFIDCEEVLVKLFSYQLIELFS